jgi:hypothetical protein
MAGNEIDLLPSDRQRILRRHYLFRLATVVTIIVLILVVSAAALLVPTYMYLLSAGQAREARLATVESTLSSGDGSKLAHRLAALETDAATIATLSATPSASEVIRKTLTVARSGVALTGLSYVPEDGSKPGALTVSGVAATRNSLRAYQLALLGAPGFSSADLPVSSYAKDHDIPFAISVILATSTKP